jgi:hypothetical protein
LKNDDYLFTVACSQAEKIVGYFKLKDSKDVEETKASKQSPAVCLGC